MYVDSYAQPHKITRLTQEPASSKRNLNSYTANCHINNENGARLAEGGGGGVNGKDETATGVSEYVQISRGGKFAATSIPWSSVMASVGCQS